MYVKENAIVYIWVDDPLVWSRGKTMAESIQIETGIWAFISANFDMKGGYSRISKGNPIDFLSMRDQLQQITKTDCPTFFRGVGPGSG